MSIVVKNWSDFQSWDEFLHYYFRRDDLWRGCFRNAFVERYGDYPDQDTPLERVNYAADEASRIWKMCWL